MVVHWTKKAIEKDSEARDPQFRRHFPLFHVDLVMAYKKTVNVFKDLSVTLILLGNWHEEQIFDDLDPYLQ